MDHFGNATFFNDGSPQAFHSHSSSEPSPADPSNSPAALGTSKPLSKTSDGLHKHSCVVCATRKIKCDRREPCGNCVKGKSNCLYRAPAPPRRRKKGAAQSDVLERLKRAEKLLEVRSETSDPSSLNNLMWRIADMGLEKRGQLVNSNDSSRYLDNSMWIWLNEELRDIRAVLEEDPEGEAALSYGNIPSITEDDNFAATVFGGSPRTTPLFDQHPSAVHIMQFWQLYLQNVHPIIKVIHAPTAQQLIIDAASHLDNISKPLEALLFCLYFLVAMTMAEEDCQKRFQESRNSLITRYRGAAQASLMRADYLTSYNFQVLQAYMLYLMAARPAAQPAAMWALAGIAVRMGHRMGLHREGESLGLPIFESEMRRRLWWEIIFFDSRMAQLSGTGGITISKGVEYKAPRNVNDSELHPGMTTAPPEHDGITEMVPQMIRAEIGYFLVSFPRTGTFDGSWQGVAQSTIPLPEKDKLIDALELRMKEKFLDKLDPLLPMHLLSRCIAISACKTIRFMAHHPRQYPKGTPTDPEELKLLFDCSCAILENTLFIFTDERLEHFAFYTRMHFQYLALIYLLRTLRKHTKDAQAERGWQIMQQISTVKPPLLLEAPRTFQLAVSDLSLSAWEARRTANPGMVEPEYIHHMRQLRGNRVPTESVTSNDTGPISISQPGGLLPMYNVESKSVQPTMLSHQPDVAPAVGSTEAALGTFDWDGWEDLVDGGLDGMNMPWQFNDLSAGSQTGIDIRMSGQFSNFGQQGPQM